jgi:HEAT repeat protein
MWLAASATDANLQRVAGSIAGRLAGKADTQRAIAGFARLPAPAQVALLTAWSDRREPAAASISVSSLKSEIPEVRAAAIRAASRIGGAAVVPVLADLATTGDQAQVARESLARMSGPGVQQALESIALSGGSPELRNAAIGILAERPGKPSITALMSVAAGSDARLAASALKALSRMGTVEQAPQLVSLLVGATNEDVRDAAQSAVVAIAQRSDDRNRAAEPLLSAYVSAATPGKVSLLGAMAEVGGDRSLEVLSQATESRDPALQSAAINALANTWSDPNALPILLRLSKEGAARSDRVVALRGYLRIVGADDRAPASERISRIRAGMAAAERPEEKRQALSVLRNVRTREAVEMAASALDDPQVANEAADAVLYLASRQRRGNREIPAVSGPEVQAALDKVIRTTTDESVKSQAQKLRQG